MSWRVKPQLDLIDQRLTRPEVRQELEYNKPMNRKTIQGLRKNETLRKYGPTACDWDFAFPTRKLEGAVWLESQTF